jgi:C4-dicarboxylate-specific signal transduction histidine kinase
VTTNASESQPNLQALALATLEEAQDLSDRGQHLAAHPLAQRAVDLARESADRPVLGAALTLLCQAEYRLGRQAQAFAVADEAYALLGAIGDLSRQALVLNVRAMIEWNSGNGARAIGLWRKGLLAIRAVRAVRADGQSTGDVDTASGEYLILHHLAGWLSRIAEYPGAIQYAKAGVAVWQGQPQHAHRLQSAAALLAGVHADYADDLRLKGRHAEAAHQAQCAASALIPLDPQTWRSLDYSGLTALCQQSFVQSFLCDWPRARASTAAMLRAARLGTLGPAWYAMSIETLGQLHWYAGRMGRAGVYWQRSAQKYQQAGLLAHPLAIFDRRIEAQAALGAFDAALALQKEYRALRTELHLQATALRVQIDMIERQNERRRRQASDALLHGQRLAVMGRLIAQTHHALHLPVASALALTAAALACDGGDPDGGHRSDSRQRELTQLMQHLVQHVDGAARLVSQLKLFTYRSSPEPTALLLREVLRNEWQAITQQGSLGEVTLEMEDSPTVHAWADVQRLCILLRVLLIELTQMAGLAKLSARIEATDDGQVLLHLMVGFGLPLADTTPSLGLTLCQEIAVEMSGHLQIDQTATALQGRLRLPDAGQRLGLHERGRKRHPNPVAGPSLLP